MKPNELGAFFSDPDSTLYFTMGETLGISHNVFEKMEREKERKEKLKKYEDWQQEKKEKKKEIIQTSDLTTYLLCQRKRGRGRLASKLELFASIVDQ